MATAPEVTEEAVKTAESFDHVLEADSEAEVMYILFEEDTPKREREEVYSHLNDRLDTSPAARPRIEYDDWGLELPDSVEDPEEDDRFVELYLLPKK